MVDFLALAPSSFAAWCNVRPLREMKMLLLLTLNIFHIFSTVSIIDFKQVSVSWVSPVPLHLFVNIAKIGCDDILKEQSDEKSLFRYYHI